MKRGVYILVFVLLDYVHSAPAVSETVWLKDVTSRDQTNKRTFEDHHLPNQLTFHLKRGSGALTLKLKRNYDIDPNADIYVVQKTKDGRSVLTKSKSLEQEDVAYYQDREYGAYMTVRCVKRLNQQCDRVIDGNMQLGKRSYSLRPAETDNSSGTFLKVRDLIGKRYLLLDETNIELENLLENKDAATGNEVNIQDEHKALLRHFTDTSGQLKTDYYVKVAVLIDSGVWNRYSSRVKNVHALFISEEVRKKIREAYSHIMNGVNLRYKTIEDPSISISIILSDFIFFQDDSIFPHKFSKVVLVNGKTYMEAHDVLQDLNKWDEDTGANHLPVFDHAMYFTTHDLYVKNSSNNHMKGLSNMAGVCKIGTRSSVIESHQYARTVLTATHELAHNLGADHDGEGNAIACKSDDEFIMTTYSPPFDKTAPYSRNPWIFSKCSVETFKKTLKSKQCVKNIGSVYSIDEWSNVMKEQPGYVFTPNEQCYLSYGPNSVFVGTVTEEICHLLRCTNPATGRTRKKYVYAARGTMCGENMWCIEGRCISIGSE